jgi:hypothetical protein
VKAVHRRKKTLGTNRAPIPRAKVVARRVVHAPNAGNVKHPSELTRMGRHLKELGVDNPKPITDHIRSMSTSRSRSRSRAGRSESVAPSRSRSRSRGPEVNKATRMSKAFKNERQQERAAQLASRSSKRRNKMGRAGEGDRTITTKVGQSVAPCLSVKSVKVFTPLLSRFCPLPYCCSPPEFSLSCACVCCVLVFLYFSLACSSVLV